MMDVMTTTSTLTKVDEAAGCEGMGGCSGSPASAGAANAQTSAIANAKRFIVGLPPFSESNERDSIPYLEPLFTEFWRYHCAGEPYRALETCDHLLEVIDPADFTSHVRQANARAAVLRTLLRYRESKAVHLSARPFLGSVDTRIAGDHHHGLGLSLKWLGEHARALEELKEALRLHRLSGEADRATRTSVNIARLYVAANRPGLAHQLLDTLESSADVETARAMAYEIEGNKPAARKAIATALYLLSDSENRATRTEALCVMGRIEGEGNGNLR